MISRQTEKYGWEFIFLGANIDAVQTGANLGISEDRAVNYHADNTGTALNFDLLGDAVCDVCASRPLSASWRNHIDADYKKRKKN